MKAGWNNAIPTKAQAVIMIDASDRAAPGIYYS